jgi:hypothetical protein
VATGGFRDLSCDDSVGREKPEEDDDDDAGLCPDIRNGDWLPGRGPGVDAGL